MIAFYFQMLSLSYEDIVIRDPFEVLQRVIYSDMEQQRQICRQKAHGMSKAAK